MCPIPRGQQVTRRWCSSWSSRKTVRSRAATVVEGAEPFAEQARSAALTWQFEPARRGVTTVAARIRARVAFHRDEDAFVAPAPPAGSLAPATTPAPSPGVADPLATPASEPPVEITVTGERHELGRMTLSKADIREMPGRSATRSGPSRHSPG